MLGLLAEPVHAADLTGTWQTAPDAKAQTGHVQITPCGATLCGTVVRAFDHTGRPIVTANVGKRILWDVKASGATGTGRVYVPVMSRDFPVRLVARGNRLDLKACNALGICKSQVWNRVN